jgi:hypothetical protein
MMADLCADAVRAAAVQLQAIPLNERPAALATRVLNAALPFLAYQILHELEIRLEDIGAWDAALQVADEMDRYPRND